MNRKRVWVFALAVAAAGAGARADVLANHNGNGGTLPGFPHYSIDFSEVHSYQFNFGTFTDVYDSFGTSFTKRFNEMGRHELDYTYEAIYTQDALNSGTATSPDATEPNVGQGLLVTEIVTNNSGVEWGGYRFGAHSADIYYYCASCAEDDPPIPLSDFDVITGAGLTVMDIGFSSTSPVGVVDIDVMTQMDGSDPIVELGFENPLGVGEQFTLSYVINYLDPENPSGDDAFHLFQEPLPVNPIPAPGAAVLAMLGFSAIGWVRRKLS